MVNRDSKLFIWDWNGTLLDDTALCYQIANDMRVERGMQPLGSISEYRGLFRFPVQEYYRDMGYTFEVESYEQISVEFVELYAERLPGCPLQPHARQVLMELKNRGLGQILLSATGADRLSDQVALFGLSDCFDQIVGGENNLAHGKAAQARELIQKSGLGGSDVLFIGDTDHDREVAAEAGCQCLLLASGHQPREKLLKLGVPLIDDLSEILPLLNQ